MFIRSSYLTFNVRRYVKFMYLCWIDSRNIPLKNNDTCNDKDNGDDDDNDDFFNDDYFISIGRHRLSGPGYGSGEGS